MSEGRGKNGIEWTHKKLATKMVQTEILLVELSYVDVMGIDPDRNQIRNEKGKTIKKKWFTKKKCNYTLSFSSGTSSQII